MSQIKKKNIFDHFVPFFYISSFSIQPQYNKKNMIQKKIKLAIIIIFKINFHVININKIKFSVLFQ